MEYEHPFSIFSLTCENRKCISGFRVSTKSGKRKTDVHISFSLFSKKLNTGVYKAYSPAGDLRRTTRRQFSVWVGSYNERRAKPKYTAAFTETVKRLHRKSTLAAVYGRPQKAVASPKAPTYRVLHCQSTAPVRLTECKQTPSARMTSNNLTMTILAAGKERAIT